MEREGGRGTWRLINRSNHNSGPETALRICYCINGDHWVCGCLCGDVTAPDNHRLINSAQRILLPLVNIKVLPLWKNRVLAYLCMFRRFFPLSSTRQQELLSVFVRLLFFYSMLMDTLGSSFHFRVCVWTFSLFPRISKRRLRTENVDLCLDEILIWEGWGWKQSRDAELIMKVWLDARTWFSLKNHGNDCGCYWTL